MIAAHLPHPINPLIPGRGRARVPHQVSVCFLHRTDQSCRSSQVPQNQKPEFHAAEFVTAFPFAEPECELVPASTHPCLTARAVRAKARKAVKKILRACRNAVGVEFI